jgi:ectoine hydroxylase-related dioxygenase (phytanoyl-CoA dioxygenase family)
MEKRPSTLNDAQVRDYHRDGFVVAKKVFTETEVRSWIEECDRLSMIFHDDPDDPRVQRRGHVNQGMIPDRIDPVLDISPVVDGLSRDTRLIVAAGSVLGTEATVFKGKFIMKRPGTLGYGMHQDYPYWEFLGVPASDFVNVFVAIDPFDVASGATECFPGLHHARIPPPSHEPLDADEACIDTSRGVIIELLPGDIALQHGMTPHRSAPNFGLHSRRAFILTYVSARHVGLRARYERERVR